MIQKILSRCALAVLIIFMTGIMMGTASAETRSSQTVSEKGIENSVNINTATIKELSTLSGVGKKKAEAIIAYRMENGQFKTVDELIKVEGIGTKILKKIQKVIVLE